MQLLVHAVYHDASISTAVTRPSGVTLHPQTTNYNSFLLGTISSVASCTRSVQILLMTFNSHVTSFFQSQHCYVKSWLFLELFLHPLFFSQSNRCCYWLQSNPTCRNLETVHRGAVIRISAADSNCRDRILCSDTYRSGREVRRFSSRHTSKHTSKASALYFGPRTDIWRPTITKFFMRIQVFRYVTLGPDVSRETVPSSSKVKWSK